MTRAGVAVAFSLGVLLAAVLGLLGEGAVMLLLTVGVVCFVFSLRSISIAARFLILIGLVIGFFVLLPAVPFVFQAIFFLLVGWAFFLADSAAAITINPAGIAIGLVALGLFVVGLHLLLRWLRATVVAEPADPMAPRHWPFRATLAVAAVTITMFTAGISLVGMAHQLVWMATSKEPLLSSGGGAARRNNSANKLKQIAIAAQNFYDTHSRLLPAGVTVDGQGRALHGWQTMILPYIDEAPLYNKIDRTRPWNNPVNLPHFRVQLDEYLNPSADPTVDANGFGLSHYAGNVWVLGGTKQHTLKEIKDGASKTFLAGESAGNFPAWGKPGNWRDPALGVDRSPDGFGGNRRGATQFVMVDGSVREVFDDVDPAVLKALSTPAGGEEIKSEGY